MCKDGGLKSTIEYNICVPPLLCRLFGKAVNKETNNTCAGGLFGTLTYDATDKMVAFVVVERVLKQVLIQHFGRFETSI